jgi:peroxiredoxin/mono/diheme cytochrome c family protein
MMLRLLAVLTVVALASPIWADSPVQNFTLQDYRGKEVSLKDFSEAKAVVVAFLGTECPLVKLYGPRLQQIADQYADNGVVVIGVNSNQQDSVTEIAAYVRSHELKFPMLKDPGNKIADAFKADRTPEVFLLDAKHVVRYRGRVDDQYVVGIQRDHADREDLKQAIDDLLAGKDVEVARTEALGCLIGRVREPNEKSPVTYSNQIVRIFQKRCESCHRPGEIAPFTLQSYDDVVGWGEMIGEVVANRRMPPWSASPEFGHFSNDRSLPQEEREQILAWVENGCPQGDPKDLPAPQTFIDGWQLSSAPESVFPMRDKPFDVPADGGPEGVRYQNFWVDPKFKDDKWVREAEVQPGNRAVVHHIIVYVHPDGKSGKEEFLTAYVPGARVRPARPGTAKKIPADSWFRFQVHYTPIGTPQTDLCRVGFLFADPKEITHQIITTEVANVRFELKPNTDNQIVTARSKASPVPIELLSLAPHMHLRGKSFKYELESPDGNKETLLDIPHYDFNWQGSYVFEKPLTVPAGARLFCTAVFDNSSKNLANPNPDETVRWGDQSWEEMMIGYFDIMIPKPPADPNSSAARAEKINTAIDAIKPEAVVQSLDKNGDKLISKKEAQGHPILEKAFSRVDANGDKQLNSEEIQAALDKLRRR